MSKLGAAGVVLLAALVSAGCPRKTTTPPADAATLEGPAAVPGGLTLVEIRGKYQAFSGLPAVKGIMIEDHNQHQLADGTYSINAYLSSTDLIDVIRSRGLAVKVLQTTEELIREGQEIARRVEAADHPDAGRVRARPTRPKER
jgi:hypothetical protein